MVGYYMVEYLVCADTKKETETLINKLDPTYP